MKLFIKSACVAFVLAVIYSVIPFQAECTKLPDDVFRLHIVANSDSDSDQAIKLKVRDKVLEYTSDIYCNAKSKQSAEALTAQNLSEIKRIAEKTLKDNGFNYTAKAEITNMYFDTRHYDDYTLPSGKYDALRITLGSGSGKNWWCVMYPSICISSSENADEKAKEIFDEGEYNIVKNEKFEYKFKIVEFFEFFCSLFAS